MNDFQLQRLYWGVGFLPGDHVEVRDDAVFVDPVRPPREAAALIVSADSTVEIPGQQCVVFRVVAMGKQTRAEDLKVKVGDVVTVRSMALDPIHPNTNHLFVDAKHILSKVA